MSRAVSQTLYEMSANPETRLAQLITLHATQSGDTEARLSQLAAAARGFVDGRSTEETEHGWSAASWISGVGAHHALAEALLLPLSSEPAAASQLQLEFVRSLGRDADGKALLRSLLLQGMDKVVDRLWSGVEALVSAVAPHRAPTSASQISMRQVPHSLGGLPWRSAPRPRPRSPPNS